MNKCLIILAVVGVTILSSCHKDDSPIGPSTAEGKFFVDSIGTTVLVKTDTISKQLSTFVTLSLVYHYETFLGTLDNITFSMANSYGMDESIDYLGAESANDQHRFKQSFQFPDSLIGQGSVKILRGLSGAFWTKDSANVFHFSGSFSWKDSLYVPVNR